jgi:hypothetical protein
MEQHLTLMRIVNVLFWFAIWFAMEGRALEAILSGITQHTHLGAQ